MCIHNTSASFLSVGIVWCCGSSLDYCLLGSTGGLSCKRLKGDPSSLSFSKAPSPFSDCGHLLVYPSLSPFPIPSLSVPPSTSHRRPNSSHCWQWIRPTAALIVYWSFRCQWGRKDPAGLSASLTPLSQWVSLPSHLLSCQAGKSKYLSSPTTMASSEEKETLTRAHARPVGNAAACLGPRDGLPED